MDDGAVVAQLSQLGLTTYEAKAYVALTRRDSSTAAQAARLAGVPRQRIYDVLASLVEKGLAVTRPGRVIKYAPTAPDAALEGLLERRRQELAALERSAEEMVQKLKPAYDEGQEQTDPLEYIEVLRDRRAINERFEELQARDQARDPRLHQAAVCDARAGERRRARGGALDRARSVYEYSAFDDPAFVEGVRRFVEAGEEARFVRALPLKLVIIDETIVMFGMEDPVGGGSELTLLVVEHPSLAKILKTAFMATWNDGLTFDEAYDRLVTRRAKSA